MTTSSASPVVTVASGTSAGAAGGSVINVSSLVSQLVAATRAPQDTLIANQTAAVTTQISAVGTLKSALSTFQSALGPLSAPGSFAAASASSSNPSVFTASAGPGAVPGNYTVSVTAAASSQQLLSGAFAGGSTATVGTGTLNLQLGGASFSVTVDSTDNTVAGLAAAINAAGDNPGISAAVIEGTDGAHLLLTSNQSGAANTLQLSETDAGTGLASLTYGTGNTTHYTENAPARDASFSVAGVAYTSASNTVSDAISGVTLNLLGPSASGATPTLTVANDTATVSANIQTFVSAYNTLSAALKGLGSYDAASGTAGPMLGDPVLTGVQNELHQALETVVGTTTYNSLPSLGIITQSDGTMSVDSARLQTALSTNFSAVSQLFSSSRGVAAQLNTQITSMLATGGMIDSRSQTLVKQNTALTNETNALDTQMTAMTASLTQQYSALNVLLSTLQTTSAYLTQAISSLPSVQAKSNG